MPSPRRRPIAQRAAGWPSIDAEMAGDFDPGRYHVVTLYAFVGKGLSAIERGDLAYARSMFLQARDLEARLGPVPNDGTGDSIRDKGRVAAARIWPHRRIVQ